jgi:4-amino-4-deoxy-L-arabinose transferase-like glycosyltransferase
MENNKRNNKGTKSLIIYGVLLLSAVSAFWMLSLKTLDAHECFVSVTAREMLQSGDWIMPTCNGEPRINKTPLSYWLVACFSKITGQVDEFTARLPSAVFAFLSAAAILYFVNGWLGLRAAALSTAVWATSLSYIRCSHTARPDMALTFFVELCFLSFYSAITAGSRKSQVVYMLIFWTSFGLANLAKGPAPLPYVLVPLFFYIAVFRQWGKLPKLLPVIGTIIFLLIMLPWPLAIARQVHWDLHVWKREFVDRLVGDYQQGHYPVYFYLLMMFKYVTPWVIFLPMALAAPFYRIWNRKQPVMQFLWLWFVADVVFLTIDGGKRQHYIVPLMPAMAILIGILLEDMIFVKKAYSRNFAKNTLKGHIVPIIAVMLGAAIYFSVNKPELFVTMVLLSVVTIIAVLFVTVLFVKNKPVFACLSVFIGITVWFMVAYSAIAPLSDRDRPLRNFAEKLARTVPQTEKLVAYKKVSSTFVQYFGRVVPVIKDKSALYNQYEQGDWVVGISGYENKLVQDNRMRLLCYWERDRNNEKKYPGGVLFHKSAPLIQEGNDGL